MRWKTLGSLDKPKVQMSMSKWNLYKLVKIQLPGYKILNFYQQKWKSKSLMRHYHGEKVPEKQWERIFMRNKRLRGVVPMDPAYLAKNDGSVESAGRGSGLEKSELHDSVARTPYMNMTFAPLERRLDIAIFRALFASSARQARQFVVHGAVKVNGKTMRYPGYFLNPGDMFQVRPERVMFALGQIKHKWYSAEGRPKQGEVTSGEVAGAEADDVGAVAESEEPAEADIEDVANPEESAELTPERTPKAILKDLMRQAKDILDAEKNNLGGKRKQDLRAFSKEVRGMMSKAGRETVLTDSLEAQFAELQSQLKIQRGVGSKASTESQSKPPPLASVPDEDTTVLDETEYNNLYSALRLMQEDSDDPDTETGKPYATPWMPRDYLSAFAFIPRYLEVNQNICAAVYLRHPVARPGLAEVPTPFPEMTNASAFAWYLRRR